MSRRTAASFEDGRSNRPFYGRNWARGPETNTDKKEKPRGPQVITGHWMGGGGREAGRRNTGKREVSGATRYWATPGGTMVVAEHMGEEGSMVLGGAALGRKGRIITALGGAGSGKKGHVSGREGAKKELVARGLMRAEDTYVTRRRELNTEVAAMA